MALKTRDFIIGLKKGWRTEEFCEHYKLSEEELYFAVDKAFASKQNAKDIKKQLQAKRKRKNPAKHPRSSEVQETSPVENISCSEDTDTTVEVEDVSVKPVVTLQDMLNLEAELSASLCKLETDRNQLRLAKKAQLDALKKYQSTIFIMTDKLRNLEAQAKGNIATLEKVQCEIDDINKEISAKDKELAETRNAIDLQKKVTIFAFEDGSIECENLVMISVPTLLDSQEIYQEYSSSDSFEDLSMRELKQLSRLTLLAKTLKENNILYEISFERSSLEAAWNIIS